MDQLHDGRTLQQQIDDTRTVVTDGLVTRILEHCINCTAGAFKASRWRSSRPIGHRVWRRQQEAEAQRALIAGVAGEEEKV